MQAPDVKLYYTLIATMSQITYRLHTSL